jgi:hypothetical protein
MVTRTGEKVVTTPIAGSPRHIIVATFVAGASRCAFLRVPPHCELVSELGLEPHPSYEDQPLKLFTARDESVAVAGSSCLTCASPSPVRFVGPAERKDSVGASAIS